MLNHSKLDWAEQPLLIVQGELKVTVQFFRTAHQFGHCVSWTTGEQTIEMITNVEAGMDWPPSPPVQDVHFEDRDANQILFGVGMAGKSHYSLSIESNRRDKLSFEFACHLKEPPQFLGVTYHLGRRSTEVDNLVADQITPLENSTVLVEEDLDESTSLIIQPKSTERAEIPATVQWGFKIQI